MPKIFSEADKTAIRRKLLDAGLRELEQKSFRRIAVDDLVEQAGIAKGTFYRFFPSKEAYFYEIMLKIRELNRARLLELFRQDIPSREALTQCLVERYTRMKSVYVYFPPADLEAILHKIPSARKQTDNDSMEFATLVGSHIRPLTEQEAETIVGMFNLLGLAAANRFTVQIPGYEPAVEVFCAALSDYILKGEKPVLPLDPAGIFA